MSYCSYFSYVEHEMWGLEGRWKGGNKSKKKKKKKSNCITCFHDQNIIL